MGNHGVLMVQTRAAAGFVELPSVSPNPAITFFAVVFGTIWTVTNLYGFYPLVQTGLERLFGSITSWRSNELVTNESYAVGDPPSFDALLAAYDETGVIEQSVRTVCDAHYPGDVTLTVLLEPDDDATRSVVDDLRNRYDFDVLTVPERYPGEPNKPRALNYGFEHTSSDVVGVIDAEDIVDPELFTQAAQALTRGADFVQARLDMVNEGDGWLNMMFRAEYGFWYNVIMPAFAAVGYPVPLGGTSNFVRRDVMDEISKVRLENRGDPWTDADWEWIREQGLSGVRPWDPRNVTEDFELGLLLWEYDYNFEYLTVITSEESPPTFSDWLRQRTRWEKGKIYTFLDRIRDPPRRRSDRAHVYWQSVLPHLGPVNLAGVVIITLIGNLAYYRSGDVIGFILALGLAFGGLYCVLFGAAYYVTSDIPRLTRLRRSVVATVTLPLYWLVQWGADIRAAQQTYAGQFHWEKTPHIGRTDANTRFDPSLLSRPRAELTIPKTRRRGALAAIVTAGFGLRAFNLGGFSLWGDELYAVTVRSNDAASSVLAASPDLQPPLYHLLLEGWMSVAGTSPGAVRSLSVLFGLGTIVAVYLLATELFDDRTGLFAALLTAMSTFFVHYSRIARMYSLLTLLTAVSWYWFVRLRETDSQNDVGYALFTVALLYTHAYGLFVVAAQHVYVGLSDVNGGIKYRRWLRVQVVVGALALPWLVTLAGSVLDRLIGADPSPSARVSEPTAAMLTNTAISYVGYPNFYPFSMDSTALYVLASAVFFVYVGQLLASFFRLEEGGPSIVDVDSISQLATLVFVVIAVPFLVSVIVPIYVPSYTAGAAVGIIVLAARGLRNVPTRKVRAGLLAVVAVSSLLFVGVYHTTDSAESWDRITASVQASADGDDLVIHQPAPTDSYARHYYDDPVFAIRSAAGSASITAGALAPLGNLSRVHDAVYLVQYSGQRNSLHEATSRDGPLVTYLTECHRGSQIQTRGAITVFVFERDGQCPDPGAFLGNQYNEVGDDQSPSR